MLGGDCAERMTTADDRSIATRASLLNRLRDLGDDAAWQRFFDTYWRLIHGVALRSGLTEEEAQDVVQETVISMTKHLPGFQYDPKVCSFKTWMLRLTRWRILDQISKRLPLERRTNIREPDDATAVAEWDRLTGGAAPDLENIWNEEWEQTALASALEQVKRQVDPQQFQMFDLYVLRKMPPSEVAHLLGTSVAAVYLTKHRLAKRLRSAVAEFETAENRHRG